MYVSWRSMACPFHLWKWCPCNGGNTWGLVLSVRTYREPSRVTRTPLWFYQSQWTLLFEASATCHGLPWSGQSTVASWASLELANPRNAAAGTLRRLRQSWPSEISQPSCIKKWESDNWSKQSGRRAWEISPLRLCREPRASAGQDMEQIWDFIQKVAQLREDLPTISMGSVVSRSNDLAVLKKN